jgi:hypothetical protein
LYPCKPPNVHGESKQEQMQRNTHLNLNNEKECSMARKRNGKIQS